jgi:hypothetical protein
MQKTNIHIVLKKSAVLAVLVFVAAGCSPFGGGGGSSGAGLGVAQTGPL